MKKQKLSFKTYTTGKGFSKPKRCEDIYIDVADGSGLRNCEYQIAIAEGRERNEALINFTFPDGRIWGGTIEELQQQLNYPNHEEYKF